MAVDTTKTNFYSGYPADLVVATGTVANGEAVSVVNDGATSDNPQSAKVVTSTIANSYGRKCFVRARWSVDSGSNWQSLESRLIYAFDITDTTIPATETLSGLRAAISIGVSDSTVYFRTANGYHGNVTYDGVSYSYTPTSQTFIVEWALFERE